MTTKAEKAEAIARLREWIKPGDTIYTTLESVSRSGMSRVIRLIKIEDNEPRYLAYNAHLAGIGSGFDRKRDGIKVGGCGMDMGFALVYALSHLLFGAGYECIGEKCPSNSHVNGHWVPCDKCANKSYDAGRHCYAAGHDPEYERGPYGPGVIHKDGYALRHRWL